MGKRLVVASGRHERRFRNQRRPEAVFSHRLASLARRTVERAAGVSERLQVCRPVFERDGNNLP